MQSIDRKLERCRREIAAARQPTLAERNTAFELQARSSRAVMSGDQRGKPVAPSMGGNWLPCSPDMPDLPGDRYEYRLKGSNYGVSGVGYSLHCNMRVRDGDATCKNYEYRELP